MEGLANYEKEKRPWGNLERFTHNEMTTVKILTIAAGEEISLQTHEHRDEFWRVINGAGVIRINGKDNEAKKDDSFFISRLTEHRATSGSEGLTILEIAFGDVDENDIKRLADRYGRA
jgi:mannose-1-phosphate guanylyltransferase/mannose-1-phosphate guanylyltransferase/mannose-6-phosphate isomerase